MPSLTQVKPEPMTVVVGGVEYKLPVLNIASLRRLQGYLDKLPSPVDRVAAYAAKLPEDLRAAEFSRATAQMAAWPPQLGSAEAMPHISTVRGLDAVIQLMVRQGQPGLDDARVAAVAGELDLHDVQGVLDLALGLDAGDAADPKAGE